MRKKVLVAEQSDATRSVAETVLRQNGFDVIAVADSKSALEAAEQVGPDLLIVGHELVQGERPVYDLLNDHPKTAEKPLLIFADAGKIPSGMSGEMVIPRPFDPRDFLEKVLIFTGQKTAARTEAQQPAASGDESLDDVLGNDTGSLQITDSEVMDQTTQIRRRKERQAREAQETQEASLNNPSKPRDLGETGRVDFINIEDDQTDIRRSGNSRDQQPAAESSDDLNILDDQDQYSLSSTSPGSLDDDDPGEDHDYHWFINEMQKEVGAQQANDETHTGTPALPHNPNDNELTFTNPSSTLEPFNPSEHQATNPGLRGRSKKKDQDGTVEKFIDEFRREVEKFQADDETEQVTIRDEAQKPKSEPDWEETIENISPEKAELFTRQLSADIADRIAARIVDKLDSEKLLQFIKAEIIERMGNKKQ